MYFPGEKGPSVNKKYPKKLELSVSRNIIKNVRNRNKLDLRMELFIGKNFHILKLKQNLEIKLILFGTNQ